MDVQFVRLDDDISERVNRLAEQTRRRVSDLVNEILRTYLKTEGEAESGRSGIGAEVLAICRPLRPALY